MQDISAAEYWEQIKTISNYYSNIYPSMKLLELSRNLALQKAEENEKEIKQFLVGSIRRIDDGCEGYQVSQSKIIEIRNAIKNPYGISEEFAIRLKEVMLQSGSFSPEDVDLIRYSNRNNYIDSLTERIYSKELSQLNSLKCDFEDHIQKDMMSTLDSLIDLKVEGNGIRLYMKGARRVCGNLIGDISICIEKRSHDIPLVFKGFESLSPVKIGIACCKDDQFENINYTDLSIKIVEHKDNPFTLVDILRTDGFRLYLDDFGYLFGNGYKMAQCRGRILDMWIKAEDIMNYKGLGTAIGVDDSSVFSYAYFSKDDLHFTLIKDKGREEYIAKYLIPVIRMDFHHIFDEIIRKM